MDLKTRLIQKIDERLAIVGIVGMGYVGLPLAVAFAQAGFQVIGVDVDRAKVDSLNQGVSYVEDVSSEVLASLVSKGCLSASDDYRVLASVDTISICVPTPLRGTKDPDMSYIISTMQSIQAYGGQNKLIVLESTSYPGTTEEVVLPRLVRDGARAGQDFFLAFSPERIDPGRSDYTMYTTPKVIGGITPDCLEVAMRLYGAVVETPVPVSSTKSAEMVKLLENTFRSVNIGLVNEIAIICNKLGIDVWEVINAAATKPYGFMKFTPGPGLGGHCIPVDPHYLSWKLKTLNYNARFIGLADEVNSYMPTYVVEKATTALNDQAKAVRGSRVLILGVAYKPNIGDVRESPALDIIDLLLERGAEVQYHDPHVPQLERDGILFESVMLDKACLNSADCTIVVSDHQAISWELVSAEAPVIVDTRNTIKTTSAKLYTLS